ncbi:MAG TPA: DUF1326 domain-containing protein [Planctomycetota bacterium]|nr:DUF1326 domain-containing protein [Planctomycetota bacterium]
MKTLSFLAVCGAALVLPGARAGAAEPVLLGEYVEARTCDVWTGPCFANGEINLRGDTAILGWSVTRGTWNSADLSGLSVVAVLDAEGTLTTDSEGKVRSVVYLDERASEEQGKALLSLAVDLAPKYLKDIVRVEKRKISFRREDGDVTLEVASARPDGFLIAAGTPAEPSIAAGQSAIEVKIKTSPLSTHCDSICGNEEAFYPTLASVANIECAKTIENYYGGTALGLRWSDPNKRSAVLGQFTR